MYDVARNQRERRVFKRLNIVYTPRGRPSDPSLRHQQQMFLRPPNSRPHVGLGDGHLRLTVPSRLTPVP
jgi:hypothetical protein